VKALFVLSLTVSLIAGSMARADLCGDIRALDAQSNDVSVTLPVSGEVTKCTRSLVLSGGSQLNCGWAFTYRAPAASEAFENLIATITDCLGAAAHVTADLNVNHPDFYDLQTFRLEGQEIGISLKDKASLSETYIFLRVTLPE
jgi:hypothetical protein